MIDAILPNIGFGIQLVYNFSAEEFMRPILKLAEKYEDIKASIDLFNRDLTENEDLAQQLARSTTYWVYDPATGFFGPSKFVAFVKMNYSDYAKAQKGESTGDRFNGTVARVAIERILGSFKHNDHLRYEIIKWGEARFGPHVFSGTNTAKWQFSLLNEVLRDQTSGDLPIAGPPALDKQNNGRQSAVDNLSIGKAPLRSPIPREVRREVWRRDEGKCVRCGSREKLEFDHIIPVSKGGSNTARNIELLCQNCNRTKASDIR